MLSFKTVLLADLLWSLSLLAWYKLPCGLSTGKEQYMASRNCGQPLAKIQQEVGTLSPTPQGNKLCQQPKWAQRQLLPQSCLQMRTQPSQYLHWAQWHPKQGIELSCAWNPGPHKLWNNKRACVFLKSLSKCGVRWPLFNTTTCPPFLHFLTPSTLLYVFLFIPKRTYTFQYSTYLLFIVFSS